LLAIVTAIRVRITDWSRLPHHGARRMKYLDVDHIRARNRRVVLQCIREAGAIARVGIAERVDISPTTISIIVKELLEEGLIEAHTEDVTTQPAGRGRPRTRLRLRANAAHAIGIKLALHQMAVSVTNFLGDVLASETVPFPPQHRTPKKIIDLCEKQIERMLAVTKLDRSQLLGVGIGVSGAVDYHRGNVMWSPLFVERDVALKQAIESHTGLDVVVDNEANLAGLAEKWFGLGETYGSYLLVTVEHGVGMSIVINHQIYRGAHGFAGEFGHTKIEISGAKCRCGKSGCVEAYVADYAIIREAADLVGSVPANDQRMVEEVLKDLAERADAGDERAAAIFRKAGEALGIALANAINFFDPPIIIISGQRTAHPTRAFIEGLRRSTADNLLTSVAGAPPIEFRPWGDDLWARGAAALVLEEFLPEHSLTRKVPAEQFTAPVHLARSPTDG
jgi:transcriptional regulator of PTS gene